MSGTIDMCDDEKAKWADTIFAVEGSGFEAWVMEHEHLDTWDQMSPGYMHRIGEIEGAPVSAPVVVHVSWARLNGQVVMFYEPTSRFVDCDMVDTWVRHLLPTHAKMTNRINFHQVLHAVWEKSPNKVVPVG